jgi:uncharacterized membrane protein YphA (DoxX/SURF4 family)
MKIVAMIARYLLGLSFVVFGLNAFLHFMPPPEMPEKGGLFLGLMFESGYFQFVAIIKILGGLLLLLGRFVPLGLTLLGPILVNILLFHITFDPPGIGMGLFVTVLWFIVFWQYKDSFRPLLSADGK